jgi:hypothetical protein
MTYILAWKDNSNIYITGDSAITSTFSDKPEIINEKINRTQFFTSFGEPTIEKKEQILNSNGEELKKTIIQEKNIKIHNIINGKVIVAYAGTVKVAIDVINYVAQETLSDLSNLRDIIGAAAFKFEIVKENTALVFGFFENETPILLEIAPWGMDESKSIIRFGSITQDETLIELTNALIGFDFGKHSTPKEKLIQVVSCLQSFFIRNSAIEYGVGGVFSGAFLNKDKFHWMEDIMYITFSINNNVDDTITPNSIFNNSKLVSLFYRENKVLLLYIDIKSGRYQPVLIEQYSMAEHKNKEEIKEWELKYYNAIKKQIMEFDVSYFVFVCLDLDKCNKISIISKKAKVDFFEAEWNNDIPVLHIDKQFMEEIYPSKSEFIYQFNWFPEQSD